MALQEDLSLPPLEPKLKGADVPTHLEDDTSLETLPAVDGVLAAVSQEVAQLAAEATAAAKDPQAQESISARLKRMSAENAFGGKV